MNWTIRFAVAGIAMALISCEKAATPDPTATNVVEASVEAARPTDPVSDQPSDSEIAQGIRTNYMKRCQHAGILNIVPLYNTPKQQRISMLETRDRVLGAMEKSDQFEKLNRRREEFLSDTGEDITWTDYYSYHPSGMTTDNSEFFDAKVHRRPGDNYSGQIRVEGCRFIPREILIIDREADPNSAKSINIRFRTTYEINHLFYFLTNVPGVAEYLYYYPNETPQQSSGRAILHKTDVMGWQLEEVEDSGLR